MVEFIMPTIKEECPSCRGTGIYRGWCEAPGTAVVCIDCDGDGWRRYEYKKFTERRSVKGVKEVYLSRGKSVIDGVGGMPETKMTYTYFKKNYKVK